MAINGGGMNRSSGTSSFGTALGQIDLVEIFSPTVQGQYANTTVFSPPVNREELMLRAIEALRPQSNENQSTVSHSVAEHAYSHG
jgi:hypothetical protein